MKRSVLLSLLPMLLLASCGSGQKTPDPIPNPEIKTLLPGEWECAYLRIEGAHDFAPTNPYRGYHLRVWEDFNCDWIIYDVSSGDVLNIINTSYKGFDGLDQEPYEFADYPNDFLEYGESTFEDGYFVIYASEDISIISGRTSVQYALYFRYMD